MMEAMSRAEIVTRFRDAANKPEQIKILADLNACTVKDIKQVLLEAGYSAEELDLRKVSKKTPPRIPSSRPARAGCPARWPRCVKSWTT